MVEREEQEALEQIRNEERMIQRLQNELDYQSQKDERMYRVLLESLPEDKKIQNLCQAYLQQSRNNGRKRNDLVMEYQKLNYEKKRRLEEKKGEG